MRHLSARTLAAARASTVVQLQLVGAARRAVMLPAGRLPGDANYLRGRDPRHWLTHVPAYGQVLAPNVYPGIALIYHGETGRLEYDFRLAAGADPRAILLALGASGPQAAAAPRLDARGNLRLATGSGALVQAVPQAYQQLGARGPAPGARRVAGGGHGDAAPGAAGPGGL